MKPPREDDAERAAARARAHARLRDHAWPAELLDALRRLNEPGARSYLVGGTVRDALLDRPAHAVYDVATERTPDEVIARFPRVEPVGIAHGTVLVLHGDVRLECTTFRTESAYEDARRPDAVAYTRDPLVDLGRRDLTVNALAYDPLDDALLDPFGGALDLERRVLRAVGDPRDRFHEDALRPLRVARLAAVLGMDPEPATRAALGSAPERARRIAWERVGGELQRLVSAPRPSVGLELLRECGLLALWLPELDRCVGVPQNRFHAHDVYTHSLASADAAPAGNAIVRWAALLHDVGKPATAVLRQGDWTFYGHAAVSAELAAEALERLRLPVSEREAVVHLIAAHMFDYQPDWSDATLRRWLRRVGIEAVEDLLELRLADVRGTGLGSAAADGLEGLRERIARVLEAEHALTVRDLAVDGRDVMAALGVPPGPCVGQALEALLEEVLDRPERNTREHLMRRLAERAAGVDAGNRGES